MILSFSTKWPKGMPKHMAGEPTRFPEKIWQSFPDSYTLDHFPAYDAGFDCAGYSWSVDAIGMSPKLHTIRRDEKDRWKAGNDIHFAINVRTKNQFQFAPVMKCVSTQRIEIKEVLSTLVNNHYYAPDGRILVVKVDGISLPEENINDLAINDGFDCVEDFFAWFDCDFTGEIIHWTDLKY